MNQCFIRLSPLAVLLASSVLFAQTSIDQRISFSGGHEHEIELAEGQTVEVSVGISSPSQLPANGRLAVEWNGPMADSGFRKILHALDPDVYVIYRAPQAGKYTLTLKVVEDDEPAGSSPRWRETGALAAAENFPKLTPWPAGHSVDMRIFVKPVDFGPSAGGHLIELEPNNSIAQAQKLPIVATDDDQTIHLTGGADDIEYFDNNHYGQSGDDWFRLEFAGTAERLLSVNLMPTDPIVAARVRVYTPEGEEFSDGKHLNETAHEQVEEHRTAIVRTLRPGAVLLLRVEANSPGYDLEIRVRRPAPFSDPREAVRLAMYDHVAQVSAWLMNRPRGNSLDRRLRDTGSMYGSNCMSCHTQSGVWGPAGALAFGYRIENPLHYRHLINVMYESLRPTNVLKDAANNTSLPPHDLGDGPAGTRVAGHNVLTLESVVAPRKLHSKQQIRTANYVLQTSDPSGINAAGKGSNVGRAVVIHYAAEILRRGWDTTKDVRYLDGIEQRAGEMLKLEPEFTDDLAHRVMFFRRVFPENYEALKGESVEARDLVARIHEQLQRDELAIRSSQRDDGAWGFAAGQVDPTADPAPTALALDALEALGADANDEAVKRGTAALLGMQRPYGLWNGSARTGFVTTAYALHALSRIYPDERRKLSREDLEGTADESLHDRIGRMRTLAHLDPWSAADPSEPAEEHLDLMRAGAADASAPVRYWAMIALGARHTPEAVPDLLRGLDDPVKMVREAARRGLRETLLADHGWDVVFDAYDRGSDLAREQIAAALVIRADAVMPESTIDFDRLSRTLDHMMSRDTNPAVRAWASRAAWNWWLWNPPTRERLNQAWLTMLQTPEPSLLVEHAKRYQLQALLIVNGNRSAADYTNPYTELADLLTAIEPLFDSDAADLVSRRLTHAAATYHNASYGSNGTGQLGYSTPGASQSIGRAIHRFWQAAEAAGDEQAVQLSVEAAANVIHEDVQQKLLDYSVNGPEKLRPIAANSLSDPRTVILPTTPEFVGPLVERIHANAETEDGRRQITRTTVRQLSSARWDMPTSPGRQREFFNLLIPSLDDPQSDRQWFLAEQLGRVMAANPDFRTDTLLTMVPKSFDSPLQETFWLPSAGWMLTYGAATPQVGQSAAADANNELHRFAVEMIVRNLDPNADRRARDVAVSMLYQPALYSTPEVISAASRIDTGDFRQLFPEAFERDLAEAIAQDDLAPKLELTERRRRNFAYFRDFVVPELGRPNRADGDSCFSCHGGGKVPSMSLEAPDRRTRYLSPQDTWINYRTLLSRIDSADPAASKLLRKPLNIQTGEEDGHQGGLRYKPGDRGYEILQRWVLDAAELE